MLKTSLRAAMAVMAMGATASCTFRVAGSRAGSGGSGGAAGAGGASAAPGGGGGSVSTVDAGPPPPRTNDPGAADAACATTSAMATLVREPVDIIVVIDNSQSMTNEIQAVEQNIAVNFAAILTASSVDYRVIMVSRHGSAQNQQSICITTPLSGAASCTPPPPAPVNAARFFHYSIEIGSHNSFGQLLAGYRRADEFNLAPQGWSGNPRVPERHAATAWTRSGCAARGSRFPPRRPIRAAARWGSCSRQSRSY